MKNDNNIKRIKLINNMKKEINKYDNELKSEWNDFWWRERSKKDIN